MSAAVRYQSRGPVGLITLDRPDNRNSMTPELLDAFVVASAEARADRAARAVVITGTGGCFSSGADFKATVEYRRALIETLGAQVLAQAFVPAGAR